MNPRIHRVPNTGTVDPSTWNGENIEFSTDLSSFELAGESLGNGRLLLTAQRIVFVPSSPTMEIVTFDYRSIALHAISARDEKKYVFVQLMSNEETASDADDDVNENNDDLIEIFPTNEEYVTPLFEHMNAMASLHPDTDDEGDYDDAYDSEDAGDGSVPEK